MSLVLAVKLENNIVLASDSRIVEGNRTFAVAHPKIVSLDKEGHVLMGITGSVTATFEFSRLSGISKNLPVPKVGDEDVYFLHHVVPVIREKLEQLSNPEFDALVCIGNRIFRITVFPESDEVDYYEIGESYFALGSGSQVALGAMDVFNYMQSQNELSEILKVVVAITANRDNTVDDKVFMRATKPLEEPE